MDLFSLKDKVAIVTGASGLIGKKHCEALDMAGATVVACDLNIDDDYWSMQKKHAFLSFDVTKKDQVISGKEKILDKYGKIDILVNNAAINDMFENPSMAAEQSKFENYPIEMWQKSLDVNVTGVFICPQVFGTVMAESGRIIKEETSFRNDFSVDVSSFTPGSYILKLYNGYDMEVQIEKFIKK